MIHYKGRSAYSLSEAFGDNENGRLFVQNAIQGRETRMVLYSTWDKKSLIGATLPIRKVCLALPGSITNWLKKTCRSLNWAEMSSRITVKLKERRKVINISASTKL